MLEKSESSCIIYSTVKQKKVFSKQQFLSRSLKFFQKTQSSLKVVGLFTYVQKKKNFNLYLRYILFFLFLWEFGPG